MTRRSHLRALPPEALALIGDSLVHVSSLQIIGSAIACYPKTSGWNGSIRYQEIEILEEPSPWILDDRLEELRGAVEMKRLQRARMHRFGMITAADMDQFRGMTTAADNDVEEEEIRTNGFQEICEDLEAGLANLEAMLATSKASLSFIRLLMGGRFQCSSRYLCFFFVRGNFKLLLSAILANSTKTELSDLSCSYPSPDRGGNAVNIRLLEHGFLSGTSRLLAIEGSALHIATAFDSQAAMDILLQKFLQSGISVDPIDSDTETPLFLAAKLGRLEILQKLLRAGADVNESSGARYLTKIGEKKDTDYFNGVTPLSMACTRLQVPIVEALLESLADPNAPDALDLPGRQSPMMACLERTGGNNDASLSSHGLPSMQEIVQLLVRFSAEVNGRPETVNLQQPFRTSVFIAAREEWTDILHVLLRSRASVNSCDTHGDSPLRVAIALRKTYSVEILKQHGAEDTARLSDSE